MTAEIASNAANLLSDIKPGYMLGAKPRQQVIGHVIGIFAGALACTPLFFLLFLPPDADGVRSTATIVSEQFAMPAALQWKGVAEIIAKGLTSLPASAIVSMVVAAVCAAGHRGRAHRHQGALSAFGAVSIGLGVVLPPEASFAMWVGAMIFWWAAAANPCPGTRGTTSGSRAASPSAPASSPARRSSASATPSSTCCWAEGAPRMNVAIDPLKCAVVLVDYQERLLPAIRRGTEIVAEAARLADCARSAGHSRDRHGAEPARAGSQRAGHSRAVRDHGCEDALRRLRRRPRATCCAPPAVRIPPTW